MSSINFAALRAEHPEMGTALAALESWIHENPHASFLDPRQLSLDLQPFSIRDLVQALGLLVQHGDVVPRFVVVSPNGIILDNEYETPDEIPEKVPNRTFDHYFKVRKENILPIYKL